jgi:hypothetical protein
MYGGDQLVQPTLDTPPRPRPEGTLIWRRSNSHCAVLARQAVVQVLVLATKYMVRLIRI